MCKTKFKYMSVCKSSVVIVEESLYYDRTCNLLWRNLSYLSHFNCNNTSFSCHRYRILGTRQILNIDHKEGNLNTTDNIFFETSLSQTGRAALQRESLCSVLKIINCVNTQGRQLLLLLLNTEGRQLLLLLLSS